MELNCRKLFDKQAALESVGDDAELLKEIAALFSREYTDSLSALANAIQSQNSSLIESTAHSLRSTIGYFGSELRLTRHYDWNCWGAPATWRMHPTFWPS
jgi:HPt (histidine-containing phosphotransfer) domain-containing protein